MYVLQYAKFYEINLFRKNKKYTILKKPNDKIYVAT